MDPRLGSRGGEIAIASVGDPVLEAHGLSEGQRFCAHPSMLVNQQRAAATMDELGIEALVATTPENVYYLSDYGNQHCFHFAPQGMSAAILPFDASIPPTLLVQAWELPYVSERPSWMPELRVQTTISPYVPEGAELAPHEAR